MADSNCNRKRATGMTDRPAKKRKTNSNRETGAKLDDRAREALSSIEREGDPNCPVVGIVASAGGLSAFNHFFKAMPANSGAAYILVPHLDATHKSLMVELLSRQTSMPIVEATGDLLVEADHVYVIPPNRVLTIKHGILRLSDFPVPIETQTAIDVFLRSLAVDQGERAVGIVLSGTGSHGTLGIREIKRCGGMAMAQTPDSSEFGQMPCSAIETGLVDFVLPPEQMPDALMKYIQHPYFKSPNGVVNPTGDVEDLDDILKLIREQTQYDFRSYRKQMLRRRIVRRMGLLQLDDIKEYCHFLQDQPNEVQSLSKDFLIGVTAFFREPDAFAVLEKEVIPAIVSKHSFEIPIRVWVPSCATGEEAYSISILFFEALMAAGKPLAFQVYASDINVDAIKFARRGVYPASISSDVSRSRLSQFFEPQDDIHYRVNKRLRDSIVFSKQNLIYDAPFSKMDFISCRNAIIYFEPEVQQKIIGLFHFALNQSGYLMLGPSETTGREVNLFTTVSKQWRVYRRSGTAQASTQPLFGKYTERTTSRELSVLPVKKTYREVAESLVVSEYAPATALINRSHEILYITGPLVNYLEFPPGEVTNDLLALARPGLRTRLRAACHNAIQESRVVTDHTARVKRDGVYFPCVIVVRPVPEPNHSEGLLLVLFRDQNSPHDDALKTMSLAANDLNAPAGEPLVDLLEFELKTTREELQSTTEQLRCGIEELQSSNEELESSKEELQSLNEELNTVNCQLLEKVAELDNSNIEILNLMASSEIATLFLDLELRVKRFSPPATKLLRLNSADTGKLLVHLESPLVNQDMLAECQRVLAQETVVETEITTAEGQCLLRRSLPFRGADQQTEGVVVTFIDLTERKRSEAKTLAILASLSSHIAVIDPGGIILATNPAWDRFSRQHHGPISQCGVGSKYLDACKFAVGEPPASEVAGSIADGLQSILDHQRDEFSIEYSCIASGETYWFLLQATALKDGQGGAVISHHDITRRKLAEEKIRENAERLRAILDTASDAIITIDKLGLIESVNQETEAMFGYSCSEMIGKNVGMLMPLPFRNHHDGYIQRFLATGEARIIGTGREVICRRKDGSTFPADLAVSQVDHLGLFTGILRDISSRKEMQKHALEMAADEQRRIGLELHDGTQQELTGLTLFANALVETIESAKPLEADDKTGRESGRLFCTAAFERLRSTASLLVKRLSEANQHVRDLSHGIMPVQIDAEGLRSALHELAESTNGDKVHSHFESSGDFKSLHNTTATHLYRIAQEAINNAIRHGKATEIKISLTKQGRQVSLEIADNGIGFEIANASQNVSANRGMGLRTMEYRASLVGGAVQVLSRPEGGTLVRCLILNEVPFDG